MTDYAPTAARIEAIVAGAHRRRQRRAAATASLVTALSAVAFAGLHTGVPARTGIAPTTTRTPSSPPPPASAVGPDAQPSAAGAPNARPRFPAVAPAPPAGHDPVGRAPRSGRRDEAWHMPPEPTPTYPPVKVSHDGFSDGQHAPCVDHLDWSDHTRHVDYCLALAGPGAGDAALTFRICGVETSLNAPLSWSGEFVAVTISDEAGTDIWRTPSAAGGRDGSNWVSASRCATATFRWDGYVEGRRVPPGRYTLSVASTAAQLADARPLSVTVDR